MQASFLFTRFYLHPPTLLPEETISHSINRSIFAHTVDDEIQSPVAPSAHWHQNHLIRPVVGISLALHFKDAETVSTIFPSMPHLAQLRSGEHRI